MENAHINEVIMLEMAENAQIMIKNEDYAFPFGLCFARQIMLKIMLAYRKTPLISTYVFSGLAMVQVLIFGAVLTFGGYDKAEAKILH